MFTVYYKSVGKDSFFGEFNTNVLTIGEARARCLKRLHKRTGYKVLIAKPIGGCSWDVFHHAVLIARISIKYSKRG